MPFNIVLTSIIDGLRFGLVEHLVEGAALSVLHNLGAAKVKQCRTEATTRPTSSTKRWRGEVQAPYSWMMLGWDTLQRLVMSW